MSLKLKKSQTPSEPSSIKEDSSGPWGRINSDSRTLDVVRFCQTTPYANQKTHSYPYRVLASWHWTKSAIEEELKIEASVDVLTVKGQGLDRIVEALDRGTLEILREIPGEKPSKEESAIWVSTITVENTLRL